MSNKKIGGLYQLKLSVEIDENECPRFCFVVDNKIHNETRWDERFSVTHETLPLMLVKSYMEMTLETAEASGLTSEAMAWTAAAVAVVDTEMAKDDDFDLAKEQWKKNKRIPGSVFMVPDGKLIWMSDIDFKWFEEVEL